MALITVALPWILAQALRAGAISDRHGDVFLRSLDPVGFWTHFAALAGADVAVTAILLTLAWVRLRRRGEDRRIDTYLKRRSEQRGAATPPRRP